MIDVFRLGLAVFATTYITRYLAGPWDVFRRIREAVGIRYYNTGEELVEEISNRFFARLFGCFWCLSTWVAIVLVVVYEAFGYVGVFRVVIDVLDVIALAGTIHEWLDQQTGS